MHKYITSPATMYDSDNEMFYTYIAKDDKRKTLFLTVWGKTEETSREYAKSITLLFNSSLKNQLQ